MGKQVARHVTAIYIYPGWGSPDDEKNNLASSRVWRMKACRGRRSTDAWSYSEEKLITDLRKYIGAFSGYMSYFPLPYYLSNYRQGKYTHKASKVQELVLICLFLETSWANIVACPSFSPDTDTRNIWGSVPLRLLEVASVIMKNLRPLIPCGTLQSLPHTTECATRAQFHCDETRRGTPAFLTMGRETCPGPPWAVCDLWILGDTTGSGRSHLLTQTQTWQHRPALTL